MAIALPPQFKTLMEGMDAKQFAVVAAFTDAVSKKFGGTDNIVKTGGIAPASIGDVRAQLAEAYKVTPTRLFLRLTGLWLSRRSRRLTRRCVTLVDKPLNKCYIWDKDTTAQS